MKKFLFVPFILFAVNAQAQAPNIVSYTLDTYAPNVTPATGSPLQSTPYMAANITCNQVALSVPNNVANPTRFQFDDAANAGKVCIGSLSSGWLTALPNGQGYTTYISQTDNLNQTSVRSAASNPFARQGSPAVLTNLKVVP